MENQDTPVIEGDQGNSKTSMPMLKNTFQTGFLSVFDSMAKNPLQEWNQKGRNGHIELTPDEDIYPQVLELVATNVAATCITCPADNHTHATLGIGLPILVIIIKKISPRVAVEVQVRDDRNCRRRFQASTQYKSSCVKPFICHQPLDLDLNNWCRIEFDLADMTRVAYDTSYIETVRVKIYPNCRIRRVFFSDRVYSVDEWPAAYNLYQYYVQGKTRK